MTHHLSGAYFYLLEIILFVTYCKIVIYPRGYLESSLLHVLELLYQARKNEVKR